MKTWSSYTIHDSANVSHNSSLPISGHARAADKDTNTRAIFLLAAKKKPFHVYGNPFYDYAGCGNVLAVREDGSLDKTVQDFAYQSDSGIHGMVFDAEEAYLYSADLRANKTWTHRKDPKSGHLTLVTSCDAPSHDDHPRWVELHPSGNCLYVLMEAGNRLAEYHVSNETHAPTFTGKTFPLIPPGHDRLFPKMYRSDVVCLSSSGKYLFATSRSNSPKLTGYIAAFKLGPYGEIERQLCLNPTPTSGGHSNAVSPCPWSDEWLALTDDEQGWLEIYRFNEEFLGRVAHVDVHEPGFGMNAIWYD
jgi:carboxy-cis,cis-muconate cyclase